MFGNIRFMSEGEASGISETDIGPSTSAALIEQPSVSDAEKLKTRRVESEPLPVAEMIFATGADDKIHEVVFQQGETYITLNDIYQMPFTIEVTNYSREEIGEDHEKEAVAHLGTGLVEINDYQPPGEDFRLRLLHEWGHLVDHAQNYDKYLPIIRKANYYKF